MKMNKIIRFVVICLMLVLMLGGCAERPTESSSFVLGFSQLGSESGWRLGNTKSIQEAAKNENVDLIFLNAEQEYVNQISHIRRLIANQVDIIVFAPIIDEGWDNVLQEAYDADIPVVVIDREITLKNDDLYKTFIGSDFEKEGERAAAFLLEYYRSNNKEVKIVELRGTENSTPANGRAEGFREVLKSVDNVQIVQSFDGDFMKSRGKEIMADILNSNTEFDVIYSHNDAMTYGVIETLEERGIKPGKDVIIISVDGEQAMIDLLGEGKVNCVVECTPLFGERVLEICRDIVDERPVPKEIYSVETVFTMWDDISEIEPRGY